MLLMAAEDKVKILKLLKCGFKTPVLVLLSLIPEKFSKQQKSAVSSAELPSISGVVQEKKKKENTVFMGCLLYENTHSCKLSVKHFILEYFSDKQLLVGTSVVIEGRLTKAVLCKNEGCNGSEDSQSNPSGGKEKSLPCRQVASKNVIIWL